jgi:hypothetical protein
MIFFLPNLLFCSLSLIILGVVKQIQNYFFCLIYFDHLFLALTRLIFQRLNQWVEISMELAEKYLPGAGNSAFKI